MMKHSVRSAKFLLAALAAVLAIVPLACSPDEVPTPAPALIPTATATATPTAVSTPAPTATAIALETSEPSITYVPSATPTFGETSRTEAEYNAAHLHELGYRAYGMALTLADAYSPRQSATDEELEFASYWSSEMARLGYETSMQEFEVTEARASGRLEILSEGDGDEPRLKFSRRDGETARIFYVPFEPLKSGIVQGEIVEAGLGYNEDFDEIDVDGKIALVSRGDITFEEKETNAAESGAIGVVVYNNEPRFYFGGTLNSEPDILAGGIPKEDGELLFDALGEGETINAELMVYPLGNGPSRNVIAELQNDVYDDPVVLIGAHYDTTPWTAGANDNGSGVATAWVLAQELSDDELPFDLRFVFFGSEETGLHGSNHYVEELTPYELGRIEAMINLDVVASGDLSALGTDWLIDYATEVAQELDFDIEATKGLDGATSDHAPFDEKGVPVLMVYADDLRYINHPSDTIQHLNSGRMGEAAAVVLGIIDRLADSIEP